MRPPRISLEHRRRILDERKAQAIAELQVQLFSPRDAAEILGVATITIRRAIKAGRIPFARIGRCIKIHRDALAEILNAAGARAQ